MSEHVEEIVTANELKEGDRVRVTCAGTVDREGDVCLDGGGYFFENSIRLSDAILTRLTPKPVLPTKRNALIERNGCVYRLSALVSDGGGIVWVGSMGHRYEPETIASDPFRVIFAGEDDQ